MAGDLIRPADLVTERTSPVASEFMVVDNGVTVAKTKISDIGNTARPFSNQAEAEAGTSTTKTMTPLATKQAVTARIDVDIASKAQGDKADTAVQPEDIGTAAAEDIGFFATAAQGTKADSAVQPARTITAGTGLTGGGDLSADRSVALSAGSQASLALADTAVQPARAISAGTGLSGGGNLSSDRTVSLSSDSQASLVKADSAVQPARTITAGTGLTGGGSLAADRTLGLSAGSQASLALADGSLQRSGGTMTDTLTFDNGTDPVIPTVPTDGTYDVNISGTSHFKIFPDLDGDGDYDADIWSKDTMYIVAESAIHLRPNFDGATDQGRLRVWAENNTNYIQSGRNFNNTSPFNDLAFTAYGASFAWQMFDTSQDGWCGLGFAYGQAPVARLHAKDGGSTIGVLESTGSSAARLALKGSTTTGTTTVGIAASVDDLLLRGGGADIVRVNTTGVYPVSDNSRILGSSSFRWSTVYAGTGTINTSDAREKNWLGEVPDGVSRALRKIAAGIGHFQFLDAVASKGDDARWHLGVTAQSVIEAFESEGLDPWQWAPICKDPITTPVEKTRKVLRQKTVVESHVVPRLEMRNGVPTQVSEAVDSERGLTEFRQVCDESGEPIFVNEPVHGERGGSVIEVREVPYMVEVPIMESVEEIYFEDVATGEYRLGLRADELFWGLFAVLFR